MYLRSDFLAEALATEETYPWSESMKFGGSNAICASCATAAASERRNNHIHVLFYIFATFFTEEMNGNTEI